MKLIGLHDLTGVPTSVRRANGEVIPFEDVINKQLLEEDSHVWVSLAGNRILWMVFTIDCSASF